MDVYFWSKTLKRNGPTVWTPREKKDEPQVKTTQLERNEIFQPKQHPWLLGFVLLFFRPSALKGWKKSLESEKVFNFGRWLIQFFSSNYKKPWKSLAHHVFDRLLCEFHHVSTKGFWMNHPKGWIFPSKKNRSSGDYSQGVSSLCTKNHELIRQWHFNHHLQAKHLLLVIILYWFTSFTIFQVRCFILI